MVCSLLYGVLLLRGGESPRKNLSRSENAVHSEQHIRSENLSRDRVFIARQQQDIDAIEEGRPAFVKFKMLKRVSLNFIIFLWEGKNLYRAPIAGGIVGGPIGAYGGGCRKGHGGCDMQDAACYTMQQQVCHAEVRGFTVR